MKFEKSEKHKALHDAWDEYNVVISSSQHEVQQDKLEELKSSFFCPGPFYNYIFDFTTMKFTFVHPNIKKILGEDPDTFTIDDWIERIHPDDIPHMENGERMAFEFIVKGLPVEKRMKYKTSYCFRMREKNGLYKLFLQQAIALTIDEDGNIGMVLGIHSDISHITTTNNYNISFIGMDNEPSYFGVNPSSVLENVKIHSNLFSTREIEVIRLLAEGHTAREAADALFISEATIRTHRKNVLARTNCKNMTQLVARCIREGLI